MLCEKCKVNEASCTIPVLMGSEVIRRHLCTECMAKMNMSIASGNIRGLLSSILSLINDDEQDEAPAKEEVVCPRCHTTWSQFSKSGHLGCPGCYEAFREHLQPMLQQVHGRVQHAGRRPLNTEKAQRIRSLQEELAYQLEQAVALEDFETAVTLRDRIRELASQSGKAADGAGEE